jgi:hypothetical protein
MKKGLLALLTVLLVIGILGYFFVYTPVMRIKAKGEVVMAAANEMKGVFKKNDIDLLNAKIKEFSGKYDDFEKKRSQCIGHPSYRMSPISKTALRPVIISSRQDRRQ